MDAFEASGERQIRHLLLEFYDAHRRELPWRGEDDPYRVWVSEVMLQQTRVETVIPYYRRWLERFPTLESLAGAPREEVLQLWTGLGYYSRARNLHRAAGLVRERFDGELPGSVEGLKELPGVGAYTAGAVASIAFDVAAPAVDGNVRRVLSRLFDLADPDAADLRSRASALVDPERPGDFNQAVMELGARICTPSSPECGRCPVSDICLARARGTVGERPPPRRRSPVREAEAAVAVPIGPDGRTVVRRRPDDGLLGGMWGFPAMELEDDRSGGADGERTATVALRAAGEVGVGPVASESVRPLEPVSHAFTHLKVLYRPYLVPAPELSEGLDPRREPSPDGDAEGGRPQEAELPVRVLPLDGLDAVPLSVAQQRIAERARSVLATDGRPPPE